MNAIYARQSVDRADSISVESQIEFCRRELNGEDSRVYIDKGYSGKNTDRPAFSKLMKDMENGEIRRVVVYKLDRISRSILDFSNMMEQFEKYKVEFVSSTERFDTASPMGRAMLNICIVFAQLERETIQKRVSDAYRSRSEKSLYMGGRIPYGYRLVPTEINGVKTAMYEVHHAESQQVKIMYELYANADCSYGDVLQYLNQNKIIKSNGKPWSRARVADILKNPVYVKADAFVYEFFQEQNAVIYSPPESFTGECGCYYYKNPDTDGRKQSQISGNCLVVAPHQGIIDSEVWLRCRRKNMNSAAICSNQKAKNTWLAGKIKCDVCGYALIAKRNRSSGERRFVCSNHSSNRGCCSGGAPNAAIVEKLIQQELLCKLNEFTRLSNRLDDDWAGERIRVQNMCKEIQKEADSLIERLSEADETLFRYIQQRIRELDLQKSELERQLVSLMRKESAATVFVRDYDSLLKKITFSEKRRVVDLFIEKVNASAGHISVCWRV